MPVRRMLSLTAIALFFTTSSPPPASALTAREVGERYSEASLWYWGRAPQCPQGVQWIDAPEDGLERAAYATIGGCTVWIKTGLSVFQSREWSERLFACYIVVHEIGHLLGYRHGGVTDYDPLGVMGAEGPLAEYPAGCVPAEFAKRRPWISKDRRWCLKNVAKCRQKYPHVAVRVGLL